MHKTRFITLVYILTSISIYAQSIPDSSTTASSQTTNNHIEIRSVRSILGTYDPIEHMQGQLRAGYVTYSEDGISAAQGYALGGHFHLYGKRWNGVMVGAEAYGVLNTGMNQHADKTNEDFFNKNGDSFITLTQLYLDGTWGNSILKLGRQILDTPHADSDDIRMMPN